MSWIKRLILIALACCAVAPFAGPLPARALEFSTTGFDDDEIPQSDILFNPREIELSAAEISLSGTALSTDDEGNLLVNASWCQPGERRVDGSASYTWRSCGNDSTGDIDVHLTLDEITVMNPYQDVRDANILLLASGFGVYDNPKQGGASLQATAVRPDGSGGTRQDTSSRLGASVKVNLRITKAGTNEAATGNFVFSMRGLNGADEQMPAWSERVDLIEGFSGRIFGTWGSKLSASPDATSLTATGGSEEGYTSGFAAIADQHDIAFRWTGRGCRQLILDNFAPANVIVNNNGHGRVVHEGVTVNSKHAINWAATARLSFVPDTCYDYPTVSVNGIPPRKTTGWNNTNTVFDLTFTIEFTPLAYQFRYEPGRAGGGVTMAAQDVVGEDQVVVQECSYAFPGHDFIGWSTDKSGGGNLYLPGQRIGGLGTVNNKTVRLYAIWEPVIVVRVPTVALCTVQADGSVVSPDNWMIENDSVFDVEASIESSGIASGIGVRILDAKGRDCYRIDPDGSVRNSPTKLRIASKTSAACSWVLGSDSTPWGTIDGESLQRILPDLQGVGAVGNVTFMFERA